MREWITDDKVGSDVLQSIRNGVIDTGRDLSEPLGGNASSIACALTEDSLLMGGATGRTEFQRLFVNFCGSINNGAEPGSVPKHCAGLRRWRSKEAAWIQSLKRWMTGLPVGISASAMC